MKTYVTIIRHGETEWNKAMRLQGKMDSALTFRGKEQVELVSVALKNRWFDVMVSSDLGRAVVTANSINQFQKLDIQFDSAFRERNFGVMEGLTLQQIGDKYPEVLEGYKTRTADYIIPDGESLVQFSARVINRLNEVVSENKGKKILLVAHGGVLDCIFRTCFQIPLGSARNFSIFNAAINVFSNLDGQWKLEEWGNIDHFEGMDHPLDEFK